jgi:hypothetical protein
MHASPGKGGGVPEAQNDPKNLDLLAAASHFYGAAKWVAGLQFALTVPVAIGSYFAVYFHPGFKLWATFIAITVALIDALILERIHSRWRRSGALAQERFDCAVLRLHWNKVLCGQGLEPAEIARAAKRHRQSNPDLSHHKDWYPAVASQVDPASAALICQRSAVRWDSVQRRRYSSYLIGMGGTIVFLLCVIALRKNYTASDFILGLYAPLAPAVLWTTREAFRQRDAASRLDTLRSSIDGVWEAKIAGHTGEALPSRALQDALVEARCRNAVVFDWIYWLQRSDNEDSMKINADEMVRTVKGLD